MWKEIINKILNSIKNRNNIKHRLDLHIENSAHFKKSMNKQVKTLEKHMNEKFDRVNKTLDIIVENLINKGG